MHHEFPILLQFLDSQSEQLLRNYHVYLHFLDLFRHILNTIIKFLWMICIYFENIETDHPISLMAAVFKSLLHLKSTTSGDTKLKRPLHCRKYSKLESFLIYDESLHSMYKHYNPFRIMCISFLNHEGRVTHICFGICIWLVAWSASSLIWVNAGILLLWPLGTKFCEIFIEINISSFEKNTFENVCEIFNTLPRPWIKCFMLLSSQESGICYFQQTT